MRVRMAESLAVGYALRYALQAPIEAATKFETALLDIAQKAELGDAAMTALGQRMRGLAPTVNQSAMDIARAMDTLLGMGLDGTTSETILPTLGKTATAYSADIADLAKTAMAAIDNLKLKAEELPRAMDMIARAGKEGAFELKDMAQYLPALAAVAEVNGMRGIEAIGELGAALQITRKGAGDSAEAATNLRNVLQKLTSEQVVGKFKKLGGIDLKKQLDAQVKAGVSPLEAIINITRDIIEKSKGKIKISDLFTDMQMQLGMAALVQHYEEFLRIRQEMQTNSRGMVDQDFARRLQTMSARMAALTQAWEIFKITAGGALAPSLLPLLTRRQDDFIIRDGGDGSDRLPRDSADRERRLFSTIPQLGGAQIPGPCADILDVAHAEIGFWTPERRGGEVRVRVGPTGDKRINPQLRKPLQIRRALVVGEPGRHEGLGGRDNKPPRVRANDPNMLGDRSLRALARVHGQRPRGQNAVLVFCPALFPQIDRQAPREPRQVAARNFVRLDELAEFDREPVDPRARLVKRLLEPRPIGR